jgi:hypothetical protein
MIRRRVSWAWWGFAGGVAGLAMNLLLDVQTSLPGPPETSTDPTKTFGPEIVDLLDRTTYHLAAAVGLVAVLCLIMFATAWRRWAGENRTDLPALAVAPAVVVTATLVLLATGIKATLAETVVGAVNADVFPDEGIYTLFMIDDSAGYFAWWGVQIAAGLVAWLSFKDRLLPAWFGVVTVIVLLPTVVVFAWIGALNGAGATGPIWLILASLYLALRGFPEVERSPQHNTETM